MNEKNKKGAPIDLILIVGLILWLVYTMINRFLVGIPDIVAYPWMIISCAFMIVGLFRTGKKLGGFFKKQDK